MKQFFGAFLGSILGIVISTIVAVLIIATVIKSSFNSLKTESEDEKSTVSAIIKIEFNGELVDREEPENPLKELKNINPLSSKDGDKIGLNSLLKKINAATADDKIKGLYLEFKDLKAGFADIETLRKSLKDFKSKGKFIYAYSELYGQKEYYLASVASKVFLNPQGDMQWKGLSMNLMFYKNLFEKLGVEMQVFRHGKFKSAVEPFILDKMSESNRKQSEAFLGTIWNSMLSNIAIDRKLSIETLNSLANNLEISNPEVAKKYFVDALLYEDEVILELKNKTGIKATEKKYYTSINDYNPKNKIENSKNKIAVIYAEGSIESGEGSDEVIGSARIAQAIKDARNNKNIKAIVFRVNSPGGSALASDVIWREVVLAKKEKPFIVSMGNLAASGGYYISCAADRIFAEPNTITGSIGVFGMIPNLQKVFNDKLGITMDTINTNLHSDMGNTFRKVSEVEYTFIQKSVEKVYDTFTKRVAEGRKMTQAQVDSIGQGRVWAGADALKIGLVDELGGINEAVLYAAKKVNLNEYKITELPKQTNPLDKWLGKFEKESESKLLTKYFGNSAYFFEQLKNIIGAKGIQARIPFEVIIN
ncbi:MAG: signal peptide peptidase SppA [Bacteroidetes bacterium]|nr:signal peptide peptidase SppA [Bacteroidota bacterium]